MRLLSNQLDIALVQKEVVEKRGFTGQLFLVDNLLAGPSRKDFDQHIEVRARYFGDAARWRNVYAIFDIGRDVETVCLWGCKTWAGRLAIAFVCANRHRFFKNAKIATLDLPLRETMTGISCGVPENTDSSNARFHSLSSKEVELAAEFWLRYTSPASHPSLLSPRWSLFPARNKFQKFISSAFPRKSGERLFLSELDNSVLLSCSKGWSTAADLFVSSSRASILARRWAHCAGDVTLARRLDAWSTYPNDEPALEIMKDERSPLFCSRYRLTLKGVSLLEGIPDIHGLPEFVVGGMRAYDTDQPIFVSAN